MSAETAHERVDVHSTVLRRNDGQGARIVLLDLGLPEVSGYRVMRVLRRTAGWEHTPVMVVTAYNFEEAADVIRDGVDEFVTKPFEIGDLVGRVVEIIGGKTQRNS